MESSLCSDHVSFNSYPNLIISLKNKNILHSMILHIKTHNYNMLEGWVLIPLIFKIHYKTIFLDQIQLNPNEYVIINTKHII